MNESELPAMKTGETKEFTTTVQENEHICTPPLTPFAGSPTPKRFEKETSSN